jgi:hypothetical protein
MNGAQSIHNLQKWAWPAELQNAYLRSRSSIYISLIQRWYRYAGRHDRQIIGGRAYCNLVKPPRCFPCRAAPRGRVRFPNSAQLANCAISNEAQMNASGGHLMRPVRGPERRLPIQLEKT